MSPTPAALRGLPQLEDLGDLKGRRVLVRTDFNVPLAPGPNGTPVVADDFRIRASLDTLRFLVERGAQVSCCSHLGRPTGPDDPSGSTAPVRVVLDELCPEVELLENLRYDPGEKANDRAFVDRLVHGYDAYVNEAFGVSHRAHGSIVGPPARLPSAAGRRLVEEVRIIGGLVDEPPRPFVAVLGGAKVADKLGVVAAIAAVADAVLIGGGMAFTFLAARGESIGSSLVDLSMLDECRGLLEAGDTVVVPSDVVALSPAMPFGAGCTDGDVKTFYGELPDGWTGLDIGEDTAAAFAARLADAATILWNGPMGAFEDDRFARGTNEVAEAIAASAAFSVVGGGDSARALARTGHARDVSFISTGGGACLSLLEHGDLPGLAALRGAPNATAAS